MSVELRKKLTDRLLRFTLMTFLTIQNHDYSKATVTYPPVNFREGTIINWYGGKNAEPSMPGPMVMCPNGTFATGFQLKLQGYDPKGYLQDNTGINGIRLYCALPGTPDEAETKVESTPGSKGSWRADHVCDGLMVGFHVKGEYFDNARSHALDHVGAVSMIGLCSNPDTLKIQGEDVPEIDSSKYRGRPLRCLKRQAICGVQAFLGPTIVVKFGRFSSNDLQGLTRIAMKCCNIPVESQHCYPTDSWRNVLKCDNSKNNDEDSSLVCTYSLQTRVEKTDTQSSTDYVMASQKKEIGIELGFELSGLSSTFQAGLAKSQTTGQEWGKETSKTFSRESKTDATFTIPPGVTSKLDQVVGQCDQYNVRPNVLRRTDMKPKLFRTGNNAETHVEDDLEITVSDYTEEAVKDRIRYQENHQPIID